MSAPDFIAKYGDAADQVSKETGIPAERILGQAGLETGWNINSPGNNFFGIKAGGGYAGPSQNLATHEADASGALVPTTQSFRAYSDPTDSFRDYGKLIQSGYKGALDPNLSDAQFAQAIKAGGYATDPNYAAKLHGSIQLARQHHKGGWENVPDAQQVIGAGAGLAPGGPDDSGWETVPNATPPSQAAGSDGGWETASNAAPAGKDGYSLEGLAQNAATDVGNIWEGMKGLGKRAVDDATGIVNGKPQQAAGDVLSVMKVLNPLLATAKGIQQGLPMAKEAITDPAQAAKDTADYVYQRPVTSAMNAAAVAFPGAGGAAGGALRGATGAAGLADRLGAATVGRLATGVSADAAREAVESGIAGGARGAEFRGQMRGNLDPNRAVRIAEDAANDMRQEGWDNYRNNRAQWGDEQVDPSRVQTALSDARAANRDAAGVVQSPEAEEALTALQGHMDTCLYRILDSAILMVKAAEDRP